VKHHHDRLFVRKQKLLQTKDLLIDLLDLKGLQDQMDQEDQEVHHRPTSVDRS